MHGDGGVPGRAGACLRRPQRVHGRHVQPGDGYLLEPEQGRRLGVQRWRRVHAIGHVPEWHLHGQQCRDVRRERSVPHRRHVQPGGRHLLPAQEARRDVVRRRSLVHHRGRVPGRDVHAGQRHVHLHAGRGLHEGRQVLRGDVRERVLGGSDAPAEPSQQSQCRTPVNPAPKGRRVAARSTPKLRWAPAEIMTKRIYAALCTVRFSLWDSFAREAESRVMRASSFLLRQPSSYVSPSPSPCPALGIPARVCHSLCCISGRSVADMYIYPRV